MTPTFNQKREDFRLATSNKAPEKVNVSASLQRLEELTSKMDVPVFRRNDVFWLARNLAVRNAKHDNFEEANEIISTLSKMGVR